jgi:hypothetical protein
MVKRTVFSAPFSTVFLAFPCTMQGGLSDQSVSISHWDEEDGGVSAQVTIHSRTVLLYVDSYCR